MLSYPAAIPLSSQLRARWRRLPPGRQVLLTLAHLRNCYTYTRLAAGFAIGTATAWRYVREAVDLHVTLAPNPNAARANAQRLACAILDDTIIPIDLVANQRAYYSRKHKRHGANVQVLSGPGRLPHASPALPGTVHDMTATRAGRF